MSTAAFPDILGRQVRTPEKLENFIEGEDGGIQISRPHPSVRYRFGLRWEINSRADAWSLESHHNSADGYFVFFDQWPWRWDGLAVGTGNAVQTIFNLPFKEAVSADVTMYLDGVATAGTFTSGTGPNGADQFEFAVAPGNGVVVSCNVLEARRQFDVVYASASFKPDNNEADLWQASAELISRYGDV